jgi:Fur family transcriptional regulator, ferric uptake regulator
VTRALSTDRHATVADRLRRLGQRYTSNRRLLVNTLLEDAGKPMSIPDILARHRTLPQSSVYRNLTVLEHAGAVRRVVAEDEFARYELAEDLTRHHHHLICSHCGNVEDVTIPPELETRMDRSLSRLAKRERFATAAHRLDLIGTCRNCA